MSKIIVQNTEISVIKVGNEDYICLTDMIRAKDGDFFVTDWLRNRNTMEFLGIWEQVYNPNFNYGEFATIRSQAGLNNFKISVKEFVARTNAICLQAKAGRYGGTYAHKDIAFEFAMWISPEFKIYIVKEFQRLKADEQKQIAWTAKRELSKLNYHIHTDAIKNNLVPPEVTQVQASTNLKIFEDYKHDMDAVVRQIIRENQENIIPAWYIYVHWGELTSEEAEEFMREDAPYAHHPLMERPWKVYRDKMKSE